MLTFPLSKEIQTVEDLVDEIRDIASEFKKDYPNFLLLSNIDKKAVFLLYVTKILDTIELDVNATLKEILNADQDVIVLSKAIYLAFIDALGLPTSEINERNVRSLTKFYLARLLALTVATNLGLVSPEPDLDYSNIYLVLVKKLPGKINEDLERYINFILSKEEMNNITI